MMTRINIPSLAIVATKRSCGEVPHMGFMHNILFQAFGSYRDKRLRKMIVQATGLDLGEVFSIIHQGRFG